MMSAQYSVLVSHVLMRFCFWLREISYARYHTREIYGKVKDGFLAKASLSWHELRYHGTLSALMFINKREACLIVLFLRE